MTKLVSVKVVEGESLFFAENENSGKFITGETRNESVNAFCEQLIDFYRRYTNLNYDHVRWLGSERQKPSNFMIMSVKKPDLHVNITMCLQGGFLNRR